MNTKKPLIMAHRGASFYAPENTGAAFKCAIEFHADGIETDLQLTGDHRIVIHHNYFIDDTSDGSGAISLMTVPQLKKYDFGAHKAPEFTGEHILTLEELLPMLEPLEIINLELKSPLDKSFYFVSAILAITDQSSVRDKIIFSSFDADLLGQIKKQAPKYPVGLLTFTEQMQPLLREMSAAILSKYPAADIPAALTDAGKRQTLIQMVDSLPYKPDFLHPDYHSVLTDPALVTAMHDRGIGVNPYTCDSPEEIQALIDAGCDGIITNRPDIALQIRG